MEAFKNLKVVELPGLAPVPFCGKIFVDFGADVTFVKRLGNHHPFFDNLLLDGKKQIELDFEKELLKLRDLILQSDVLLDPYRPGVLEDIGLHPEDLMKQNKQLIVARISGYGQTGPYSKVGGHDINYVALSGIMEHISGQSRPLWPSANLLGDFAGGAWSCAFGICAALLQRQRTGLGSVVDASMTEGVAYLASYIYAYQKQEEFFNPEYGFFTGRNVLYRTYETKDGRFMACGALEPKFHNELFRILGVDPSNYSEDELVQEVETVFKSKTRDEWYQIFEKVDACVTPVLHINEVGDFKQHKARNAFYKENGLWKPRPAPRIYSGKVCKPRSKL